MDQPAECLVPENLCCAVCLDDLHSNLAALPCGHVFHQLCASRALTRLKKCPICRTETLAKQVVRLFYSSDVASDTIRSTAASRSPATPARRSRTNSSAGTAENSPPSRGTLSTRFSELQQSVNRLTANQRMISSHSFRLQTENARLRQENARATEQLDTMRTKQDGLVKELSVWRRISTTTYAQLQALVFETSEANKSLLASMKELTRELLALSMCASCERVTHASSAQLQEFCQAVESKASSGSKSSPRKVMPCCTTENASRALRGFCARHSSASSPAPAQLQQSAQAE